MKATVEFEVTGCDDCLMCNCFNGGDDYECLHPDMKVGSYLYELASNPGYPDWCPILGKKEGESK